MRLKTKSLSETIIQTQILNFLRFKGIFAWRNNNGAVYDPKAKCFRKPVSQNFIPGISDILGMLPSGHLLAIEVKTPEKFEYIMKNYSKLKIYYGANKEMARYRDQIAFINKVNGNGGSALFASSIEDVQDFFEVRSKPLTSAG